jgi:hypothetical protein
VADRKEQEKKTQFIRSTVGTTKWVASLFIASIKLLSKQPLPMDDTVQSSINEGLPAIEAWYNECSQTYQYQGKWDFILMMIMNMTKPLIDMIGDKATQKIAETGYRYQPLATTPSVSTQSVAVSSSASPSQPNTGRFVRMSASSSSSSAAVSNPPSSSSSNSGSGGGFINMVPSVVDANQTGFNMIQQLAGSVTKLF